MSCNCNVTGNCCRKIHRSSDKTTQATILVNPHFGPVDRDILCKKFQPSNNVLCLCNKPKSVPKMPSLVTVQNAMEGSTPWHREINGNGDEREELHCCFEVNPHEGVKSISNTVAKHKITAKRCSESCGPLESLWFTRCNLIQCKKKK